MQVLARRVLTFLRSFYSCSQKYKKVWHFLRKTLDICLRFGYNNTRRQGHGPRRKEYADVAELADALDSGSSSLKRVWVQIPSSAPKSSNVCSGIFCFSDLFGMTSTPLRRWRFALFCYRYSNSPGPAPEPGLYDFTSALRHEIRQGLALLQPLVILGGSGKLNVASGVQRRLDRILDDTNDKADTNDLHRNVIGDTE